MDRWYQLLVSGNEKALRGFVAGFGAGRGAPVEVVWGSEVGLEGVSWAERVRGLLAPDSSPHLLFVPQASAAALGEALRARGGEAGLALAGQAQVQEAAFDLRVETVALEVARAVREQLLQGLPREVQREGWEEQETHRPDAAGAELYAPEHPFEYRARGTVRGPFPSVAALYRRARALAHVEVSPLRVDTREG